MIGGAGTSSTWRREFLPARWASATWARAAHTRAAALARVCSFPDQAKERLDDHVHRGTTMRPARGSPGSREV